VTGNVATIEGTCTLNGKPCTFRATATDNGEPGRNDTFTISINNGPTQGGQLTGGNIQVHKQ
jgi:hypothetical protein